MKTSNKGLLIGLLISIALVLGVVFVMQAQTKKQVALPSQTEDVKEEQGKDFVVDVDQNIDHWQTKGVENEAFIITFPKEWYWMESDPERAGYWSRVITNDPNFDINQYSQMNFHLFNSQYFQITDNDQLLIAMYGGPTKQSSQYEETEIGYIRNNLDALEKNLKKDIDFSIGCHSLSEPNGIPGVRYCSFIDTDYHQKYQVYYIADSNITMVFSVRTTENTNIEKELLDKIFMNVELKSPPQ